MNKIKLIIANLLLSICFLTSCKGQTPLQLQQTYSSEIIGTWVNQKDSTHKLEFTSNGRMRIYSENELVGSMNYAVVISCNGNTMSDGRIYLRLEEEGNIGCDTLEAVNRNNSGILSITTEHGKLETYTKEN